VQFPQLIKSKSEYLSYEKSVTFRRFTILRNVGCQISRMWDLYRIIYI